MIKRKLYILAYCRDNQIETVVKVTQSINLVYLAAIAELKKVSTDAVVSNFKQDINTGTITDNFVITVYCDSSGDLNLQLTTYEFEVEVGNATH